MSSFRNLDESAEACQNTKSDLLKLLLPGAEHIARACAQAGMVNVELFNQYVVEIDDRGEAVLTKHDMHGQRMFALTAESGVPELLIYSEDLLNGLVSGIAKSINERTIRASRLQRELLDAGVLVGVQGSAREQEEQAVQNASEGI